MTEELTLSAHFNQVWKKYVSIEDLPTDDQQQINSCIDEVRHLMESVEQLDLYSNNEDFDEISTSDIKFLLLPALLGKLHQHRTVKDRSERPAILQSASENFTKFLRSCALYGVGSPRQLNRFLTPGGSGELPGNKVKMGADGNPDLGYLKNVRDEKIRKFREEKERKEQISELQKHEATLDDSQLRKYWKLQILQQIHDSLEQIDSIERERKILTFMSSDLPRKRENTQNKNKKQGFTPFMLTKDRMQAQVFGQGYPSLPTMTLDEFYDREAAQGRMGMAQPAQRQPTGARIGQPAQSQENPQNGEKPENEEESDDDEKVMKQREMDEWKDEHRIGDGNRYRKG